LASGELFLENTLDASTKSSHSFTLNAANSAGNTSEEAFIIVSSNDTVLDFVTSEVTLNKDDLPGSTVFSVFPVLGSRPTDVDFTPAGGFVQAAAIGTTIGTASAS
jgi:hypothetical protein